MEQNIAKDLIKTPDQFQESWQWVVYFIGILILIGFFLWLKFYKASPKKESKEKNVILEDLKNRLNEVELSIKLLQQKAEFSDTRTNEFRQRMDKNIDVLFDKIDSLTNTINRILTK